MQNSFAFGVVDLVGLDGDFLLADTLLDFELVGEVGTLLDDALLVAKLEVGVVLLFGGDPAVADEEARKVPFVIDGTGVLVAFENSLGDVGNVLTGVRLSSNVKLRNRLDRTKRRSSECGTYIVMFVLWEQSKPPLQKGNKVGGHLS